MGRGGTTMPSGTNPDHPPSMNQPAPSPPRKPTAIHREAEPFAPTAQSLERIDQVSQLVHPDNPAQAEAFDRYRTENRERRAFDLDIVLRHVREDTTILEVDAVPLLLTAAMKNCGLQLVALDRAPQRFSQAIAELGLDVRECCIDHEPMPLADNSVDMVVFSGWFEQPGTNPGFALGEVLRVLRPGGRLLLSTPNLRSLQGIYNFLVRGRSGTSSPSRYDHYAEPGQSGAIGLARAYTTLETIRFVQQCGFKVTGLIHRGRFGRAVQDQIIRVLRGLRPSITVIAEKPDQTESDDSPMPAPAGAKPVDDYRRLLRQAIEATPAAGADTHTPIHERTDLGEHYEIMTAITYNLVVSEGDEVVDGGACGGLHTWPLLRLVGNTGRVHAYEANPKVAAELHGFLASNPLADRVAVKVSALSDTCGETTFFVNDDISLSSLRKMNDSDVQWHPIQIPVTTLDHALSDHPIRFIKLDLEGAEFPALRGAAELLSRSTPVIVFENPRNHAATQFGYQAQQFFAFFENLSYELYTLFGQPFRASDWHKESAGWYFLAIHAEDPQKQQLLDALRSYTQRMASAATLQNQWTEMAQMVGQVTDNMDLFVRPD